jgi:serine/threonine protein phosphatase PrpC
MAAADTMPDYPGAPNAVCAVVSIEPGGRIEIAHAGDAAVWTWSRTAGLRRWTVDQTAGEHVAHMLRNPHLSDDDRTVLEQYGPQVVAALDDYVLNGLVYATISTISWTLLRDEYADVTTIFLTSDGVHKALSADQIAELAEQHAGDAQGLADALVDAAVAAAGSDPDEDVDNATAAVVNLVSKPASAG